MTNNQIAYWTLQEQKRANLAKEFETARSNKAREIETNRSNLAAEAELNRSHLASEFEANRANLAKERETSTHNRASEAQAMRDDEARRLATYTSKQIADQRLALDKTKLIADVVLGLVPKATTSISNLITSLAPMP